MRYDRIIGKYFKGKVDVIIDDSLSWGVDRVVSSVLCRGVDGDVNTPKEDSMWRFMSV